MNLVLIFKIPSNRYSKTAPKTLFFSQFFADFLDGNDIFLDVISLKIHKDFWLFFYFHPRLPGAIGL